MTGTLRATDVNDYLPECVKCQAESPEKEQGVAVSFQQERQVILLMFLLWENPGCRGAWGLIDRPPEK